MLNHFSKYWQRFQPWLEPVALLAWGLLMIKYWLTGKLNILIHPNYFALTIIGGLGLLVMGALKARQVWLVEYKKKSPPASNTNVQHINFFPPNLSNGLVLGAAILGLLITPQTFGSYTALQRGLTESLPITRVQPQAFQLDNKPEERALIEWIRLLNVNPEPDNYKGQQANVTGFVIYPPSLSENYIWLSRFVITCCAADAYPVGLPVLLPEGNRENYPQDSWLEVEGEMITQTFENQRKLTIQAMSLTPIPEPRNPYDY